MIAQSQSGTGKTAAFVLAMLSRVNPSLNYPQVGLFAAQNVLHGWFVFDMNLLFSGFMSFTDVRTGSTDRRNSCQNGLIFARSFH